ncbi:hypothetical protein KIS4809_5313 [Bacillus sp. ZZV12-4809]|nr:hypothetical protein KIS4809_5313 [Bacillus sp. ZZV12-4809]
MEFPIEFYNDYWHMHLPVAQEFINSSKTPYKVKRLCIQTLLERAEDLIRIKPNDKEKYRVVVAIDYPELWDSQIIVFKVESYFNSSLIETTNIKNGCPFRKKETFKKNGD